MTKTDRNLAEKIITAVCSEWGVSRAQLSARCRMDRVATPRMVAIHLMTIHTGMTWPEMGATIDRTFYTARHAYYAISDRRETDPKLAAKVRSIETKLGLEKP